jgi:hypothetical protein
MQNIQSTTNFKSQKQTNNNTQIYQPKKQTQIYATMQFVVAIFIYFFTKKEMIFFIKIDIHQYNTNSKLLKTKKINLI